jgi:hypothetical protein
MLNRKLGFISAALFLMALPAASFATTARLEGMSLPVDYTSDFTAIYGWPSAVTGVGNLVYSELGNPKAMGAVLPNLWEGRFGTWALHLRGLTPALGRGDTLTGSNDHNTNTNQSFDLMWGKKFGTTSLGLQLNRSYNELTDEVPGVTTTLKADVGGAAANLNRNILGVGAGLGFEMNSKTNVEFSILWQNRTFETSVTGGAKNEDNGGSNYMFGFRAMHKCAPNMTVVPVVKLYSFDLSNKATTAGGVTTTADNTLRGWQIGAAGNWTIGSNDLFVLGATVAQNTLDQESNVFGAFAGFNPKLKRTESMTPQIFMALETQVNPWLTLRMGASKSAFNTVKIEGTTIVGTLDRTLTSHNSPFEMNAGASVKVGTLTFDTVLNSLFYTNPFSQLLGNTNAGVTSVFPKVSASYRW